VADVLESRQSQGHSIVSIGILVARVVFPLAMGVRHPARAAFRMGTVLHHTRYPPFTEARLCSAAAALRISELPQSRWRRATPPPACQWGTRRSLGPTRTDLSGLVTWPVPSIGKDSES
jgi:hypothetical protein